MVASRLLYPWDFPARILEWVTMPSRDLADPGIEPTSPALAGGFFSTEPSEKSQIFYHNKKNNMGSTALITELFLLHIM